MKVLVIGLDSSINDLESATTKRQILYGEKLERLDIVVPANTFGIKKLSQNVMAYSVTGNKIFKFFKIWYLVKKLVKEYSHEIVSVQDQYFLALIGWLVTRKSDAKLEIQIHGFEKYHGLRKLIADFVMLKANGWRTVSERQKRELISKYKLPADRISVVPVCAYISKYLEITRSYEKKDKYVILTVGRLVPVKRIDLQIKAVKEISNVTLWVVGDGPERKRLEMLAKNSGVSNRVKFWGWQKDLYNFYRDADIFLLTSESEGWGMAVVEAAAAGLPIIMTDVGCAGEIILNGVTGLVCPVSNHECIKINLRSFITKPETAKKIGEKGRKNICIWNKDHEYSSPLDHWSFLLYD